jgi:hypothetical protein
MATFFVLHQTFVASKQRSRESSMDAIELASLTVAEQDEYHHQIHSKGGTSQVRIPNG